MSRRSLTISLLAFALAIVAAAPVAADSPRVPVGDEINVFGVPAEYDAGEAFHVMHGFRASPGTDNPPGLLDFRLEIDGVDQGEGQLLVQGVGQDGAMIRLLLYNYPDGLPAGDHEFVGLWSAPCELAVESFGYPGPCNTPNEQVVVLERSHTVTFS